MNYIEIEALKKSVELLEDEVIEKAKEVEELKAELGKQRFKHAHNVNLEEKVVDLWINSYLKAFDLPEKHFIPVDHSVYSSVADTAVNEFRERLTNDFR